MSGHERSYPVIPLIQERASAPVAPLVADEAHQLALGLPGTLIDNWQSVAIARLGELVQSNRALKVFMDTCTHCGACTDKCHYFLGSADPNNMPVARQDLLRRVYQRYFTWTGRFLPKLVGAKELDEDLLQTWFSYFHQCSECRRCSVYCPKGIDTTEVTRAGRDILATVGLGQQYSQRIIGKALETGNNLGFSTKALRHTLDNLEEDLVDETGIAIPLNLDKRDVDILLVLPSADLYAEPHVDGFLGVAKVLHAAGVSWTLSTQASEAANFALFTGNDDALKTLTLRMRDAAENLGVRQIVIGECGHAWRVAHSLMPTLVGPMSFLDPATPLPRHICELTAALLAERRITLDPTRNSDKRVTYHDSCNVARAAGMGSDKQGQYTLPRQLIKASCPHFFEMPKDTIKQHTFCCGGGGGLLTDELMEVRIQGATPRMHALQQVVDEHDVTHMATICAICKTQFAAVLPEFGLTPEHVISVHQLVGNAVVLAAESHS